MDDAFTDELRKIARSSELQVQRDEENEKIRAAGFAGLGGRVGEVAGALASIPLLKSLKGSGVSVDTEKLTKNMGLSTKNLKFEEPLLGNHLASQYKPDMSQAPGPNRIDSIVAPKGRDSEFMAHELGHAKVHRGRAGRLAGHARSLSPFAGMIAGAWLASDDDTRKYAPAAVAAGHVPTLLDEAGASIHGLRGLAKSGVKGKELLRAAGSLGKAFGTYGLGAAGAAGGTYLGTKLYDRVKKKST